MRKEGLVSPIFHKPAAGLTIQVEKQEAETLRLAFYFTEIVWGRITRDVHVAKSKGHFSVCIRLYWTSFSSHPVVLSLCGLLKIFFLNRSFPLASMIPYFLCVLSPLPFTQFLFAPLSLSIPYMFLQASVLSPVFLTLPHSFR